ncbi:glycyl-radical enzyme activating protein [Plebeiibacterium sediminum]|uniref:Glycyl-radical enzyme activating protein n=1 Tax=Plebeiibacterium sediminum TaxID=2992112 RepID=A0AAE3M7N2_9BACT|nr:glycyl-radical enzyme activating protein [Plebeiobacterium sediminum]MCW3788319.1 glycyl-radical enzyme activating protein [Plebeiobacterium sediminum]
MEGKIFDIKRFALNDGPGIRTTVFFKGCPLKCTWCHNPEGISFDIEEFEQERFLDGERFVHIQKIGQSVSVQKLMDEILKDVNFYIQSGGGVTFSGGEPMAQSEFLTLVLAECKKKGLHVTIDTTGLCNTDKLDVISNYADLFLYDMKFVNSDLHYNYTGVKNSLIIENLDFLLNKKSAVIVRVPIIPGINDTVECIADLKEFVKNRQNQIKELHFLPFHNIGQSKYERFKKDYSLSALSSQQPDDLNYLIEEFKSLEIKTQIGGL